MKYEDQIESANYLFNKYQREILSLVKQDDLRKIIGVPEDTVKISPNSSHVLTGNKNELVGTFYCDYMKHCPKELYFALLKMDIANAHGDTAINHFLQGGRSKYLPQVFLATDTFYAGGGDGHCDHNGANYTTVHDATSSSSADYTTGTNQASIANEIITTTYYIKRAFFPVDTSSLTTSANISAASFAQWSARENDSNGYNAIIVTTTQASTTQLVTADYDNVGTVDNGSIDFTNYATSAQYNSIDLNATGLSNISKTGITQMGLRLSGDISSSTPTGRNDSYPDSFSEDTGTTHDPKYTITYSLPTGSAIFFGTNF